MLAVYLLINISSRLCSLYTKKIIITTVFTVFYTEINDIIIEIKITL